MKNKILLSVSALCAIIALAFTFIAHANPLTLSLHPNCTTSIATSSMSVLATSSASQTLTCDAYNMFPAAGDPTGVLSAALAVQYAASSTANALTIAMQYSNDGIDWYDNNLGTVSTTSGPVTVATPITMQWFPDFITGSKKKIFSVQTPTRFFRAVFTNVPIAGTSTVYAEFLPKKEVK